MSTQTTEELVPSTSTSGPTNILVSMVPKKKIGIGDAASVRYDGGTFILREKTYHGTEDAILREVQTDLDTIQGLVLRVKPEDLIITYRKDTFTESIKDGFAVCAVGYCPGWTKYHPTEDRPFDITRNIATVRRDSMNIDDISKVLLHRNTLALIRAGDDNSVLLQEITAVGSEEQLRSAIQKQIEYVGSLVGESADPRSFILTYRSSDVKSFEETISSTVGKSVLLCFAVGYVKGWQDVEQNPVVSGTATSNIYKGDGV